MSIKMEQHKWNLAEDWFEIIKCEASPRYYDGIQFNGLIDDCDINYLEDLIEKNPKLARLMPCIIKIVMDVDVDPD